MLYSVNDMCGHINSHELLLASVQNAYSKCYYTMYIGLTCIKLIYFINNLKIMLSVVVVVIAIAVAVY